MAKAAALGPSTSSAPLSGSLWRLLREGGVDRHGAQRADDPRDVEGNPSVPALAMASGYKRRRVQMALGTLSNSRLITRVDHADRGG